MTADQLSLFPDRRASAARSIRFIDLFAGIGGTRLGLESAGARCVFACEIDAYARQTYQANFTPVDAGDIRKVQGRDLPAFDLLAAGLPAASFSIAGVTKLQSLGRPHGFADSATGSLFFEVMRLIDEAGPPPILLLDSVKGLLSHDGGTTFKTIHAALSGRGYNLAWRVIDARPWVPQHRLRVFIVGLHCDAFAGQAFEFPAPPEGPALTLASILEPGPVDVKYSLTPHFWAYLQNRAANQRAQGNGFRYGLVGSRDVARTLSARYHKDGSEILVATDGPTPRRLTPGECGRLMGFPDSFRIPVSDTHAYRQFGNAAVVPTIEFLGRALLAQVRWDIATH